MYPAPYSHAVDTASVREHTINQPYYSYCRVHCELIYLQPTLCSKIVFEKLIIAHLARKSPALYEARIFTTILTRARPDPISSKLIKSNSQVFYTHY
jgi:hypothetical protein